MGSIEVICGSMFSGKTEELIKRIQELHNTNLNYKLVTIGRIKPNFALHGWKWYANR